MPTWLIDGLAGLSVLRSLVIAGGLFVAGACLVLLLIPVRHFVPRVLRRALPVWLRRTALQGSLVITRGRLALVEWLLRRLTPTTPTSAPKKGAL
jgi:hypothetical protein